jgi:hypothetical protein
MLKQLLRRIDGLKKRLEEKADPVHKTPEELDYQDQETQADAMEEGNDIWGPSIGVEATELDTEPSYEAHLSVPPQTQDSSSSGYEEALSASDSMMYVDTFFAKSMGNRTGFSMSQLFGRSYKTRGLLHICCTQYLP